MTVVVPFNVKNSKPEDYEAIVCCECALQMAVPSSWVKGKREDHSTFHCPNGHRQHFPAKTQIDLAQQEIKDLKVRIADLEIELKKTKRPRWLKRLSGE